MSAPVLSTKTILRQTRVWGELQMRQRRRTRQMNPAQDTNNNGARRRAAPPCNIKNAHLRFQFLRAKMDPCMRPLLVLPPPFFQSQPWRVGARICSPELGKEVRAPGMEVGAPGKWLKHQGRGLEYQGRGLEYQGRGLEYLGRGLEHQGRECEG